MSDVWRIGHNRLESSPGRPENKVVQLHIAKIISRKSVDSGLLQSARIEF